MTSLRAGPKVTDGQTRSGPTVDIDALELWVEDLDRTHRTFLSALGFQSIDAALERRLDERATAVANGGVTVILRQGTSETSPVAAHVRRHGDTVGDVRLVCVDPALIASRATAHGLSVRGPADAPTIDVCGDGTICHSVRSTRLFNGQSVPPGHLSMKGVDHVAHCLPWGTSGTVAQVYRDVFGLVPVEADSFDAVGDEATGMRGNVLRGSSGFTVVLTEPISWASSGQTKKFVDAHDGPGVQHVAIAYDDLLTAVAALRESGVQFLDIPQVYYERAQRRLPASPIPWDRLRQLEILVDADHNGLLFQLFARPMTQRGTFFIELIQRAGATGFGANNVVALFEAVQDSITSASDGAAPGLGTS